MTLLMEAPGRTFLRIQLDAKAMLFTKLKNNLITEVKFLRQLVLRLITERHPLPYVLLS